MKLKTNRGIIENLQIVRTQQNILYSPHMKEAAGVSAIIFAVAGMSAAVQTSANSEGGADEVDMYSFDINGIPYAGCTRVVGFKNGDEIELVYEDREQGAEVLGVRRSSTRSIWLYPYMSRGSISGVISGLKLWVICSLLGGFALLLIACVALDTIHVHDLVALSSLPFLATAVGISWILPRLYRFSIGANEVFSAFGFEKPKWVDLHKSSKEYRKKTK
ncbi:putative type VI secretion system effector [Iodobacter sp.]|uniref:putative type VI secretion system effector n=1 Tax=Iodobacter sp. TaxID=1915058 RepID=UPI0025FD58BD|nr:putative type VI secretion system effector [Iodobacter sp.]